MKMLLWRTTNIQKKVQNKKICKNKKLQGYSTNITKIFIENHNGEGST